MVFQYDPDAPFDAMSVTSLEYFHPYGLQPQESGSGPILPPMPAPIPNQNQDQDDEAEGDDDDEDDEDNVIDEIADLLDNVSEFDETQRSAASGPVMPPMPAPIPVATRRAERERRRREEKKDQKKEAFDKIKEYLHLTASAVKIKYPTVRNVGSDDLIKKVKELVCFHDDTLTVYCTLSGVGCIE